ncbi:choline dehydrogenase [Candidatus Persebacteraceae bacterium Df01]|uniref:Choline dehydrogenase n=1 Tax=Candidatus Doriopsillibacter californiensis TaxID=2970740 RepID=A0ABT7QKL5_9GAMM|nr:choline dehydrogenase [Candidatus Persebacteraceae bacterium Df01]
MSADYVIVGAGSAGCALAWRLGKAGCDVLVIEHGAPDRGILINMPAALPYPMNMPRYDWGYATEPEAHMNNRSMACPRGKVWGGSSAINGMVYVRGHAQDFNGWATAGAAGWAFADVLPYFMRMENAHDGQLNWRGTDGPLHVTRAAQRNPLPEAFIAAGRELGLGFTADYNGECQEGICQFEQTIWRGQRWSAARAYLRPALRLPNVRLVRALARRVIVNKTHAVGVEVRQGNAINVIHARREVILASSAINSPKLLMLSGIGEPKKLTKLGIGVVVARAGVGYNLQDHLEAYVQQACTKPVTLNRKLDLLSKGLIGARWLLRKDGDGATNHFEAGAFLRSPNAAYADIQFHFLPAAIRYDGKAAATADGFQAHVGHMRSASRGWVKLRDADPESPPRICFNYMSCDEDWRHFRHCIRLARDIFAQPALAEFCGERLAPVGESDAELDDFVRQSAESAYHPCGTCKMGAPDDPQAVVDSECRVLGMNNLRVVDSSIFPRIPYGNLNAPSIMVGEKAADHILGKLLPRDER